ncbi:MAG: PEP-CTERM sorting domain-containing protein [Pirellulales bacterium]
MNIAKCYRSSLVAVGMVVSVTFEMQAGAATVTTDPPPVTDGLFVELNGENLSAGALTTWQDQANDGNVGTYQNYVQTTATRQPSVVLDVTMPNGLTANVVTFDRGTTTGTNNSSTNSDYLRSVAGGDNTSTTVGADPAYKLSALTYFTVFQSTLTPALAGDARDNQMVIGANHTGANATWVTQTLRDGYDPDGALLAPGGTPDLYSAIRDDPVLLGQVGRGTGGSVQNRWYIAATSWDIANGGTRIVIRDDQGNVVDKAFTVNAFPSGLNDHIMTTLGAHSSGSNTPSTTTGQGLTGGIAELLIYNTALDESEMNDVLGYLNNKYFVASPELTGDHNGDGFVDAADYVTWRKNEGTLGQQGYDDWAAHFGEALGSSSSLGLNTSIPEPTAVVLLVMGAFGTMFCGNRRRTASRVAKVSSPGNADTLEAVSKPELGPRG